MGNAIRHIRRSGFAGQEEDSPHGCNHQTLGVSALAHDILNFDATSQVPDALSQYVVSSNKDQANWYRKLSLAWKEAKPPPRSPEY